MYESSINARKPSCEENVYRRYWCNLFLIHHEAVCWVLLIGTERPPRWYFGFWAVIRTYFSDFALTSGNGRLSVVWFNFGIRCQVVLARRGLFGREGSGARWAVRNRIWFATPNPRSSPTINTSWAPASYLSPWRSYAERLRGESKQDYVFSAGELAALGTEVLSFPVRNG